MTTRRGSLLATGALLLTTASWGSTFFLIKDLLERVPTLDFLAVRFAIAGLVMLRWPTVPCWRSPARCCARAVLVGGIYGVAQILQTAGLAHTAASVSGFITGMYVVCTPLLAAVMLKHEDHCDHLGRGGAGDGRAGRATLEGFSSGTARRSPRRRGAYALHIVALGAWSTARDAWAFGGPVARDRVGLPGRHRAGRHGPSRPGPDWAAVVTALVLAGALALLAQTWRSPSSPGPAPRSS